MFDRHVFCFPTHGYLFPLVQGHDGGINPACNHDGDCNFGAWRASRSQNLIRYTHLSRIIIPVKALASCLTAMFSVFKPTDLCFPLSRDMTAASTQRATMMALETLVSVTPPGFEFWYDIHILDASSYPTIGKLIAAALISCCCYTFLVSFIVQLTLVSSLFYFEHKSKVCFSPWRESKLVQD